MKKIFLFSASLFLFIGGCKNNAHVDTKIKVRNKLDKKVICILGYNYPDLKLDFTSKEALLSDTILFQIDTNQIKELDTLGLCKKDTWNKYVKQSLLMLFVFDKKKLVHAKTLEDALLERYYFSYTQLLKDKGVIVVY
jgi:hypothetical protein